MNRSKVVRLYHTFRYLRPVQIYRRVWSRLYTPKPDSSPAPPVREFFGVWNSSVTKESSLLRPWEFRFLNHSHPCRFPGDWNSAGLEKLWLYNLHYFDELATAAENSKLHSELLQLWIEGNPPGKGNGWEPYPTSLRIVNWIKWVLAGNIPPANFYQSLAMQVRFLFKRLEYHLLGNHLFANAKALVFAGFFFNGTEAEKWYLSGMAILRKEIPEQVLADGGHFERSPMYHSIILEDMLDMANLFQAYGQDLPAFWRDKIEAMLTWLAGMVHPDRQISLFNDAALGVAAEPDEVFAYAGRLSLGRDKKKKDKQVLYSFQESGYIRWESDSALVLLDVGEIGSEYLPGHAHADTLSFEMSLYGRRFIVDSGTSCYGISTERLRQRQTSAHNTVSVDGEDSSEVWSGFRVARRASPCDMAITEHEGKVKVRCGHDGYLRLPGKVTHHREWTLAEQGIIITDTLSGEYGTACARLFFHPGVEIESTGADCFRAGLVDGQFADIKVMGGSTELRESTYHPGFGVVEKNLCLHITFSDDQCVTIISW